MKTMKTKLTPDDLWDRVQSDFYKNTVPYSKENAAAYRAADSELVRHFRKDCEQAYVLSDNPKAAHVWRLAWDHGHSSGFSEILNYYAEFSELVK